MCSAFSGRCNLKQIKTIKSKNFHLLCCNLSFKLGWGNAIKRNEYSRGKNQLQNSSLLCPFSIWFVFGKNQQQLKHFKWYSGSDSWISFISISLFIGKEDVNGILHELHSLNLWLLMIAKIYDLIEVHSCIVLYCWMFNYQIWPSECCALYSRFSLQWKRKTKTYSIAHSAVKSGSSHSTFSAQENDRHRFSIHLISTVRIYDVKQCNAWI